MKRMIPICLIGVFGGLFLVYTAVTQMQLTEDLETIGATTTGRIISGQKIDGSVKLNVAYTPRGAGTINKKFEFSATGDTAEQLLVDDVIIAKTVDIVYLPDDPNKSRIADQFAPGNCCCSLSSSHGSRKRTVLIVSTCVRLLLCFDAAWFIEDSRTICIPCARVMARAYMPIPRRQNAV